MATKSSRRPDPPAKRSDATVASGPPAKRSGASVASAPPAQRSGASAADVGSAPRKGLRGAAAKVATSFRQIGQAYTITVRTDRKLPLWLLGSFLLVLLVVIGIGTLLGAPGYFAFIGVVLGLLVALIVFGRRAERAAYAQLEGRPGAAAAALNTLKRGWTVTPAVGGTRTLEVVHRAVGRPGIVLVGEGPGRGRLTGLLQNEARRHTRVAPGIPVITVQAGSADGQVPIGGLPRHMRKLAAVLTPADVREVNQRLKALRLGIPQPPHGPLPRGARLPKGLRPPADADLPGGR